MDGAGGLRVAAVRVSRRRRRWNSLYQRFARWQEKGVWQALTDHLAADADLEVGGDARQHRGASPRLRRRAKSEGEQALGRSRGGSPTKLHAAADALGNSLAFRLTAGQQGDAPQALPLLDRLAAKAVLADKAYDTDAILLAGCRGRGRPGGDPAPSHPRPPTPDRLAPLSAAPQDREPALWRNEWQDSRVQRSAYLPFLLHYSAVPRPL